VPVYFSPGLFFTANLTYSELMTITEEQLGTPLLILVDHFHMVSMKSQIISDGARGGPGASVTWHFQVLGCAALSLVSTCA
jgi:hypothetical protein